MTRPPREPASLTLPDATWRVLLSPPLDGARNMALDEALMGRARRTGENVLRVYSWSRATVSFGRHQRILGVYDEAAIADAGCDVVRRPTGGRAVLHRREITYSVTAALDAKEGVRQVYESINTLLVDALGRLGVDVTVATATVRGRSRSEPFCFAGPSPGELLFHDRKLAGSAQWRDGDALLQHGSILIDDDQAMLSRMLATVVLGAGRPPAATFRQATGRTVEPSELRDALVSVLLDQHRLVCEPLMLDHATVSDATQLCRRYMSHDWTWLQ